MNSLNVIFVGDKGVGKTSIINKFIKDEFYDQCETTVWAVMKKELEIDKQQLIFGVTDICCEESYASMRKNAYMNKDAIVIVFDINQIVSFQNTLHNVCDVIIDQWNVEVKNFDLPKIIIANKIDLKENDISIEEYQQQVQEAFKNNYFFSCSAKSGVNIQEVFSHIASIALKEQKNKGKHQKKTEEPLEQRDSFCNCSIF